MRIVPYDFSVPQSLDEVYITDPLAVDTIIPRERGRIRLNVVVACIEGQAAALDGLLEPDIGDLELDFAGDLKEQSRSLRDRLCDERPLV